ncbi:sensor histidine kinase KdpD [Mitsuaria sp. 7]|uniref:sensor histidine kinase n=1 Tax=Mitsuaria sp. 7 TaxID=1658665 RepID=UPI0018D4C7D1|nr:HAMP domain-containing sensor histidine kinase [Mitsuaria sp. 7]
MPAMRGTGDGLAPGAPVDPGLRFGAAALQVSEQRRSDILALVAHELRDPLAAIGAALRVLNVRASPNDTAERAVIERQLGTCQRLVEDLLDHALVSRHALTVQRVPVPLREFLSNALEATRPGRELKRHRLMTLLPDAQLQVRGDGTRLVQVVGNLLANAARYTPAEGCIELWTVTSAGHCAVHVKDNGQGISVEQMGRIFEPYVQGHRPLDTDYHGLGLGLALARAIAELHDGSITAHSEGWGQGSEFCLRLPLWKASAPS